MEIRRQSLVRLVVILLLATGCAASAWAINGAISAGGGSGPSISSAFSLSPPGQSAFEGEWFILDPPDGSILDGIIPVRLDPTAGPWIKNLSLSPLGGGSPPLAPVEGDAFRIEEFLTIEGPAWQDWHEEILTPGWEWVPLDSLLTGPAVGDARFLDGSASPGTISAAPAPGLMIDFGPSEINFFFDPLDHSIAGLTQFVQIDKAIRFVGTDDQNPDEIFTGESVQLTQHPTGKIIPEPLTAVLGVIGLGVLALMVQRRRPARHGRLLDTAVLTFIAYAFLVVPGHAVTMQSLFDGGQITIDDKIFSNWQLETDNSNVTVDYAQIDISESIVSPTVVELAYAAGDELSVVEGEQVDFTFSFAVATASGRALIKDNELAIDLIAISTIIGTVDQPGSLQITEIVYDVNDVALAEKHVEFGPSFIPFDSAVFAPQSMIRSETNVFVRAPQGFDDPNTDGLIGLKDFHQTFSQSSPIPEPASAGLSLAAIGVLASYAARRHRRHHHLQSEKGQ